ncbi:MAG: hypothetical protein JJT75_11185 [Opitutales bacterium]|nr:hypothetical protein [Opitutales bacterium]MCH8541390.1 hypothetical protein [Opitutales bacterium]
MAFRLQPLLKQRATLFFAPAGRYGDSRWWQPVGWLWRILFAKALKYHFTTSMKSIHVRDLEDEVILGLKRRAARHRRSLQKEVETVLTDAARMVPEQVREQSPLADLHKVNTGTPGQDWSRESFYHEDGR